ncbi:hypothetical protein JOQ06_025083 [Pogonophryne albipinna]|uniref:Transposase n=1 Tax=Pogonophryne albipinna TaxID=1090488 RepID=A0AAD6ATT6_9TELE|nr:hypothetical protein JOQ06_025083 [Pogonophryne albipinna]
MTILTTLYWLAHGLSYSVVSRAFQVPLSMVHRLVLQGVEDIAALRHSLIKLPAGPELEEVGQGSQQLANSPAFRTCVGAIDGCHIRIRAPSGPSGQDYVNRKGRFLQTFVGFPGSVHDTRVLKHSAIYKEALYPPPGYLIVGDGGYPCIVHPIMIVTPYREPLQGRVQSRFNGCHAKARSIIERTFGKLKVRWRCLLTKALEEALELLNRLSEAESDGGEVSGLSDVSWVCSASDGSSDSDPEPPRNVRPSHPDPPLADGPTVPAHAEVCATEPSPAQEIGKDGTVWTVMEPCGGAGRRQIQNILTESAGPTPHARHNITDKLTAFMCLCDNVMLEEIRDCTIAEARRGRATWDVSIMELKAFIALLYVRGAYCGKNIEMESFWSEQWGNAFFNATLSRNRFREIMRYLLFDKKETRRCRLTTDKFTHVRKVWDRFVENSIASYRPGSDITVDEQLFPTKSRCPFTQFMPNKPDKFGIKFWLAADVDSKYMLNGFPYLAKDASRPATQRLGENVVLRLVEPFVVYQCKPRRNVTILSTQHQHVVISTEKKKKPETVEYYNHSKVGVDVLDQMARQYSVKGGTRRWPIAVFYNVLDLAAINAWVLYRSCMSQENIPRRDFMLQLAHELRAEWMASKAPPLADLPLSGAGAEERRRMTCMVKAHCMQNKTFCKCVKCGDAVCGKCTAKVLSVCNNCV